MKIMKKDLKHGIVSVISQTPDDLWYLSQIICAGDVVSAKTERKIKIGSSEERSGSVVKKTVKLSISAERIDYSGNILRVSGKITEAPEDIPRGSYHTISVEEGTFLTISKERWNAYEIARLNEAAEQSGQNVLIVVFDREEAIFALLNSKGYEILSEIKGEVQKKGFDTKGKNFYKEIIKILTDYAGKYKPESIVLASPAFWTEELLKELSDKTLLGKIVKASCSDVGIGAIDEVLKRPELSSVLKEGRAAKEAKYVDEILAEIRKEGAVAYGGKEVGDAVNSGAVSKLFVSTDLIADSRQENYFHKIESIMKSADSMKGEVIVINSDNDAGKKLDGIGGIAALLRYKMSY
jgi:protein pelota